MCEITSDDFEPAEVLERAKETGFIIVEAIKIQKTTKYIDVV